MKEIDYKESKHIVIACEDLDFIWDEPDVKRFIKYWNYGLSLWEIADLLKRDGDEILILFLHCIRKGEIDRRESGILSVRKSNSTDCESEVHKETAL